MGAFLPTNTMMNSTSKKIPSQFYTKLNTHRVLENAKKVADNYNSTIEEIEQQMRNLYFHPYIYPEIVETYNKLERKWKVLTKYVESSRTPVLWEENN